MGAISEALAAEARSHGVDIECNARVVRVGQGWVMLEDERKITARAVVANVNPSCSISSWWTGAACRRSSSPGCSAINAPRRAFA